MQPASSDLPSQFAILGAAASTAECCGSLCYIGFGIMNGQPACLGLHLTGPSWCKTVLQLNAMADLWLQAAAWQMDSLHAFLLLTASSLVQTLLQLCAVAGCRSRHAAWSRGSWHACTCFTPGPDLTAAEACGWRKGPGSSIAL